MHQSGRKHLETIRTLTPSLRTQCLNFCDNCDSVCSELARFRFIHNLSAGSLYESACVHFGVRFVVLGHSDDDLAPGRIGKTAS